MIGKLILREIGKSFGETRWNTLISERITALRIEILTEILAIMHNTSWDCRIKGEK
jgi:hypothetical protein